MRPPDNQLCFYGEWHCGICGSTWEFEPEENGTIMESEHDCDEEIFNG